MDKSQLGAAIIAFSLLMMVSPWGLGKAVTSASQYIGSIDILVIMYSIVFLIAGVAVFFVKDEREEEKKEEVAVNA
ncbi:MAG: hypothetical protein QXV32_06055 [Conexivisphaerales archaeon]